MPSLVSPTLLDWLLAIRIVLGVGLMTIVVGVVTWAFWRWD